LQNSVFHRLSSILWGVIVTLVVLFALYVSVGRLLASNLGFYREEILAELNSRVPFDIAADRVDGEWHSFNPVIVLSGVRLSVPGMGQETLELSGGRIALDILDSLRTRSLQSTRLELDGLSLTGELDENGRFRLTGFGGGGELEDWLREFLLNIERIALSDNELQLALPNGESRLLDLELELLREGSSRYLDATLYSAHGTRIHMLGQGLGNPFRPDAFTGELYLDMGSSDLGAIGGMLTADPPPIWAEGALELELWLNWDRGEIDVESRATGRSLRVASRDHSWEIPLEQVALQAKLVERENRWTLFATDLEIEQQDARLMVPRLQLDMWGDALRMRTRAVDLESLNGLVGTLELLPAGLADVFAILQPRGRLEALQLSITDVQAPAADWEVEANFTGVEVASWHGAPGVTSASGYLELADGGGFLVLDSRDLSLDFPTVYREPLAYDDIYGTIGIDWDEQSLRLSSGLVQAEAEEGAPRVLFGLNIPFESDAVGLEMDLLVGLTDSRASRRAKYLPYILNPALQDWLSASIGEGQVEQAGFIWRGSLRSAGEELRTIQLFLDMADTTLEYQPDWPPLRAFAGLLLIDDTDVSVWSESAQLLGSQVEQLSAEAWMDPGGEMMLALDARLEGPSADGLAVLNNSPLRQYVGDTFSEWKMTGAIATRLQLQLALSDAAPPPQVEVNTRWRTVDIQIEPGSLPLRGVTGEFDYHWQRGFSSRDLTAELWGETVTAQVQSGAAGRDLQPAEVSLATHVEMADVQRWLDLELLGFARGRAAVDLQLRFPPGKPGRLTATSDLQGISLDLPPPWRTTAEEARPLRIDMPLGGPQMRLDFELDGGVRLSLGMEQGALQEGALAFNAVPGPLESGRFRISGHMSLLDGDGWSEFLETYFSVNFLDRPTAQADPQAIGAGVLPDEVGAATAAAGGRAGDVSPEEAGAEFPSISVEALQVDALTLRDQTIKDVVVGLGEAEGQWRLEMQTEWLQGALELGSPGVASTLELDLLDLAGLDLLDLSTDPTREPLEIPDLDVTIAQLRSGERALGRLAFQLRSRGAELRADNITGELIGLRLEPAAPGQLRWQQSEPAGTQLEVSLAFDDFGETLAGLGYERVLETDQGVLDLALNWPGAPQAFSLQAAEGSMRVNIGRGRFLEAPAGATGALKVVGILNLTNIVQRLSLSQMFESGIPFDTVEGDVYFHPGTIEVAQLDVRGAASRFQFNGVSDVATRDIDGSMVATLPVANNLPWVAALAGGLPVAAGVFVVSKLFEKQFDLLSSALYSISGSWNDPRIEFDRIWGDGSGQGTQGAVPTGQAGVPEPADTAPGEAVAPPAGDWPAATPGSEEPAAANQP
jgi:uncharacterized protein (TIGR02099 family)